MILQQGLFFLPLAYWMDYCGFIFYSVLSISNTPGVFLVVGEGLFGMLSRMLARVGELKICPTRQLYLYYPQACFTKSDRAVLPAHSSN